VYADSNEREMPLLMVTPKDIWISAHLLIKKYGDGAEDHAAQKVWEFKQKKDEKAAATWKRIVKTLAEVRDFIKTVKKAKPDKRH